MNISFIVGNLTKDPEKVKGVDKGLVKSIVAVKGNYTNANGERPLQFFNVSAWGKLAENCERFLKKGSKVSVLGKIQNRKWEDSEGVKRYATEVVASEIEFLSSPKE